MDGKDLGSRRQILGRRVGLAPYYRVVRSEPGYVELESDPLANRGPGRAIALGGGLRIALAVILVALAGVTAAGQGGFALVAALTIVAAVIGGAGARRLIGGLAIISTVNRIIFDTAGVRYVQRDRFTGERLQQIERERVNAVRERPQRLLTGGALQRRVPITLVELVLSSGEAWIIDSAADAAQLRPLLMATRTVLAESETPDEAA